MRIDVREAGAVRILDLHGRLVLGETDTLRQTFHRLMAEGSHRILLNLGHVPYMDSAGVGELAACKKRTLEKKGQIRLQMRRGKYHLAVETLLLLMFHDETFEEEAAALGSFPPA